MVNKQFLTTEDISSLLDVHIETVRQWIKDGKLKAFKLGRAGWRVSKEDLQDYLNKNSNQKGDNSK